MAGRQIVVELVSDEKSFKTDKSKAALDQFGTAADKAGKAAANQSKAVADIGERFDDAEQPIIGLADVMDGLTTTMGLDGLNAAVQYTRGIGDMASGIGNGLIPVLTQGTAKVKALSMAFWASPHAKFKVGVVAAAAATGFLASKSDAASSSVGWLKSHLVEGAGIVGGWIDDAAGKLTSFKDRADSLDTSLDSLAYGVDDVNVAMAGLAAQTQTLGQFASAQQGIISTMNNSFGDLSDRIYAASIQLYELYKLNGKFLSQATMMKSLGLAGPYTQENMNTAAVPGPKSPNEIAAEIASAGRARASANDRASKAGESAANKAEAAAKAREKKAAAAAEKALQDRFARQSKILQNALSDFQSKVDAAKGIRDAIKNLFKLEPGSDPTAEGGLVARLRKQAEAMDKWVKKIAELRKKGFRESLIRDLVDRGPESLADATELSHTSKRDVNKIVDQVKSTRDGFSRDEAKRRTGIDPNKPGQVKVTLNVKGSDTDLKNLIKKWVKEEGGGDVQVAFGKRK